MGGQNNHITEIFVIELHTKLEPFNNERSAEEREGDLSMIDIDPISNLRIHL
jgi:hypothetical protein